ncbi:hypothetical protein [Alkaliphilus crotonatoxidans]
MALFNCTVCGRLFKGTDSKICPRCLSNEEGPYQKVVRYVYDHYGASVLEVSEATGVDVKLILKYVKDGKIDVIQEKDE